ncbi:MAG: Rieske 2Fe-2S domain-containing protein [Myxococcota bacterium]
MDFVRNTWYFAAWAREVTSAPFHRRILGEDVALFRDANGNVRAIGAICPHRGANLSNGRVVEGKLECPYHGWRFGGDGVCAHVPSQPADHKIPPGARVPAYGVCEQQGAVWIWPASSEPTEEAPQFEALEDAASLICNPTALLDSEFVNVVENAFDDSHVYFLHTTSIGVDTPILPRQTVERDPDGHGLTMRWDTESTWGQELFAATDAPSGWFAKYLIRRYGKTDYDKRHARFRLGGVVAFHVPTVKGFAQDIIGLATPMDDDRTWFTTALSHPLVRNPVARPALRWFGRTINREDTTGTVDLLGPASQHEPISVQADRGGLAFRRLYAEAARQERVDPSPD